MRERDAEFRGEDVASQELRRQMLPDDRGRRARPQRTVEEAAGERPQRRRRCPMPVDAGEKASPQA
ncbi:MAG: hypothetical protein U5L11_10130 [Arhodomonas sp.]|nr:hypothetical protein [Arhodomonas sp.]